MAPCPIMHTLRRQAAALLLAAGALVACGVPLIPKLPPPPGERPAAPGAAPGPRSAPTAPGELLAFPGAEGFGARVTGGRGGRVITVTTLEPSGPGSLQAALDETGPRIIVFAVSGVIADPSGGTVQLTIRNGDVTIAGQTAPGAGITIRGQLVTDYSEPPSNIVVRHLRIRPVYDGSDPAQFDAIQFSRAQRVILDHISVSGGADETIDLYEAKDVTVQWSTIESPASVAPANDPEYTQNYGMVNGPDGGRVSVHHNLFAHNRNRTPSLAAGPAEVVNNVVYDHQRGFVHNNPASGEFNLIGNVYKDGPMAEAATFYFDAEEGSDLGSLHYYLSGNMFQGSGLCTEGPADDPWGTCQIEQVVPTSARVSARHTFSGGTYAPVTESGAAEAESAVLARAGAFPRDFVTRRSVEETTAGTGEWGIRYSNDDDFLAGLQPGQPPADADADGIADTWEAANGLSSSDPADAADPMPSGYPAIEAYLDELATAPGG